jgi:starch-binding outer membrane protein, SusD/RagB family
MIKYSKFLVFPAMLAFMGSCTDLKEDLKGNITEDISIPGIGVKENLTVSSGQGALESAYKGLRDAGTAYHSSYYSIQEISSDEMCIAAKGGDWFDGGILIDLHRHTYKPTHDFVKNAWEGSYNAISTTNELLKKGGLDASQTAQLRALRAYFYMRLVDMYGNVKIITTPGVDAPQSSRADVYKFVESELLAALGVSEIKAGMNLSASPLGTTRNAYIINTYGALGILSKLYLNAEVYAGKKEYAKAEAAADYIIANGPYKLCGDGCTVKNLGKRPKVASDPANLEGFAAVFAPNNMNNQEHIFSVYYDEALAGGMNFSQMNLHYSSQFTWNFDAQPWNGYATLEEFYNSFEEGDARKKASFIAGPQLDFEGSAVLDYASDDGDLQLNYNPKINELAPNSKREAGARAGKFSYKQFGRPDMDNDYPIIRLGDVYLMRAEAKARNTNNWNAALPDVNIIRARAKVAPLTTMTDVEFLKERGREMFAESSRRTDLIRFGKYNNAWWEKPASQAFVNLFPIPTSQIEASKGTLKQNDGY